MSLGQGCLTLVFASVSELKRERLAAESGLKVCVCVGQRECRRRIDNGVWRKKNPKEVGPDSWPPF